MRKQVLALVLMVAMLGSLTVFQGYATLNWGSTVNLGEVRIGVILPVWDANVPTQTLIFKLAEQDINTKLRVYGATAHFTFDIRVAGDANGHLNLVQQFHEVEGVDLIIGGYYSGQAAGSLQYINDHNMLLFSPSSTDTGIFYPGIVADDGLFRMCPNDALGLKPVNDMMVSRGIQYLVILCSNDLARTYFEPNYLSVNTIPKDTVYFDFGNEVSEDTALSDASALILAHANEKAAILVFSGASWGGSPPIDLYQKAMNYPALNKLNWFSNDPCNLNIQLYAPSESAKLHLYSPKEGAPPEAQTQFNSLQSRISAITDYTLKIYDGYAYDIAWVIAKSVLTAKTKTASDVISVLPNVSKNYFGVTGYCKLDTNGDRANPYFNIMGYYLKYPYSNPLISYCKSYGYCIPNINKAVWYNQN